ncbi:MAG: hypothetical protein PHR57_03090, partial [Patescibacteria group bacterium]|nr:hypothetical protein [Patescibacteria group bacterium]
RPSASLRERLAAFAYLTIIRNFADAAVRPGAGPAARSSHASPEGMFSIFKNPVRGRAATNSKNPLAHTISV